MRISKIGAVQGNDRVSATIKEIQNRARRSSEASLHRGQGNLGTGNGIGNLGTGNIGNMGTGNIGNMGTGNMGNLGTGNIRKAENGGNLGNVGNIGNIGDGGNGGNAPKNTVENKEPTTGPGNKGTGNTPKSKGKGKTNTHTHTPTHNTHTHDTDIHRSIQQYSREDRAWFGGKHENCTTIFYTAPR
jgi:hypothetical protein